MPDETPVFIDPICDDTHRIGIVYVQSSSANLENAAARLSRPFVFAAEDPGSIDQIQLYDRIAAVCTSRKIEGYAMRAVDVFDADVPDFYSASDGSAIFLRKQFPIRLGDLEWACGELNLSQDEIVRESFEQAGYKMSHPATRPQIHDENPEICDTAREKVPKSAQRGGDVKKRARPVLFERLARKIDHMSLRMRLAALRFSRRKLPRMSRWKDRRLPIGDESHLLGPARMPSATKRAPSKKRGPEKIDYGASESKVPMTLSIGQETRITERLTNYEAFVFITTDRQILRHADTAGFAFVASGKGECSLIKPRQTSDRKSLVAEFNAHLKQAGVSTVTKKGVSRLRRVRVAFERGEEADSVSWLAAEASSWSAETASPCAFYTHFRLITADGEIGEPCAYIIYAQPDSGISLAEYLSGKATR